LRTIKNKKRQKILGVKPVFFALYISFAIVGVGVIVPVAIWSPEPYLAIFLSIGSSFLTSSIFAYFSDLAQTLKSEKDILESRKMYLDNFAYCFYQLCYKTLYWYYREFPEQISDIQGLTIADGALKLSKYLDAHFGPQIGGYPQDQNKGFEAMKKITDSVAWIPNSVSQSYTWLDNNRALFLQDGIFNEEEYNNLGYLRDEIVYLPSRVIPCEYGEELSLMIPDAMKLKEFHKYLDKKIVIEKGAISTGLM
jgi:hypothetical protein